MRTPVFLLGIAAVLSFATTAPAVTFSDVATIAEPTTDHLLVGVEDDLANCGGTAPAENKCTTGSHLRAGGGFFGPGSGEGCPGSCNTAVPGYTGTLKMDIVYLVHLAGSRVTTMQTRTLTCNFSNGVLVAPGCVVSGAAVPAYPFTNIHGIPFITAYDHNCSSFDLGTTTPGGAGPWKCFSWHTLL